MQYHELLVEKGELVGSWLREFQRTADDAEWGEAIARRQAVYRWRFGPISNRSKLTLSDQRRRGGIGLAMFSLGGVAVFQSLFLPGIDRDEERRFTANVGRNLIQRTYRRFGVNPGFDLADHPERPLLANILCDMSPCTMVDMSLMNAVERALIDRHFGPPRLQLAEVGDGQAQA